MDVIAKIDGTLQEKLPSSVEKQNTIATASLNSPFAQQQNPEQKQQQLKTKRKHRRGKPKAKNINKPYKKTNWKFQMPRYNYNCGRGDGGGTNNRARAKLVRSRSLVPYNTNKFLMEEHLAEIPSALLTPSGPGRTRDSSFSVDSEDNYFFSLPEDEEEFLTKEFANVYEKARVERLENLTKQELIKECLQIEDRYSTDQGTQRQQQLNVQRISTEYLSKIRVLEEKVKELSRENYNLRCQLMRSAALAAAAAASPPSATAPTGAACVPTPMDSTSEDSESDSSSSSSSSSSGAASPTNNRGHRYRSCSSHSSLSENNGSLDKNYILGNVGNANDDYELQQLLEAHMDNDGDSEVAKAFKLNDNPDKEKLPDGVADLLKTMGTPPSNLGSPKSRLNSNLGDVSDSVFAGPICN